MAKIQGYNTSSEFGTPQDLYDFLNGIYGPFDLDVAASKENAKCKQYFTKEDNGKEQPWHGRVWCNPPYTNGSTKHPTEIYQWVEKAQKEYLECDAESITMLLPAKTDSRWFHYLVIDLFDVYFIKGRLKFNDQKYGASFGSIVIHLGRSTYGEFGVIYKEDNQWKVNLQ